MYESIAVVIEKPVRNTADAVAAINRDREPLSIARGATSIARRFSRGIVAMATDTETTNNHQVFTSPCHVPSKSLPVRRAGTRGLISKNTGRLMWLAIAGGSEPGHARGLLRAWPAWERIALRLWPTMEMPGSPHGLVRLRIVTYGGDPFVLPDGVEIHSRTKIGELHCNNEALMRLFAQGRNPFRAGREDLSRLSAWIERDDNARDVMALLAHTILAAAMIRLGFTPVDSTLTMRRRMERIFFKGLLLLYNREGTRLLEHGKSIDAYPRHFWISRRELIRRYGRKDAMTIGPADSNRDREGVHLAQ